VDLDFQSVAKLHVRNKSWGGKRTEKDRMEKRVGGSNNNLLKFNVFKRSPEKKSSMRGQKEAERRKWNYGLKTGGGIIPDRKWGDSRKLKKNEGQGKEVGIKKPKKKNHHLETLGV